MAPQFLSPLTLMRILKSIILVPVLCLVACAHTGRIDSLSPAEKAALMESSGFNKCIKDLRTTIAQREACMSQSLLMQGYRDGLDCTDSDAAPCLQPGRKDAQDQAYTSCKSYYNGDLTNGIFDCAAKLAN